MTLISEALRIELVWLYHEASNKMARGGFGNVVSIDRAIDLRPFIEAQLADCAVSYAVWIDRSKPHDIDCLLLAGVEHAPDCLRAPKRTVVPRFKDDRENDRSLVWGVAASIARLLVALGLRLRRHRYSARTESFDGLFHFP
jgi:hypothetical protein